MGKVNKIVNNANFHSRKGGNERCVYVVQDLHVIGYPDLGIT